MLNRQAYSQIWGLVAGCLILAVLAFAATRTVVIKRAPEKVMERLETRFAKVAGGWNKCYHIRAYGPRKGSAKRANPDSIVSVMAYDLSNGPIRLSGPIWPDYWSLSLYQQNSDNFFVVNDQELGQAEFNLIITAKGQTPPRGDGTVIVSPTEKGIMLVRRFAKDPSVMPAIHKNQDAMYCGPS